MSFPTATEQYLLELINKARSNPLAEAARLGIDLNAGLAAGTISSAAKAPLTFSNFLNISADVHSQSMINDNYFSHTGSDGSSATQRIFTAGWTSSNGGFATGENIAFSAGNSGYNAATIEGHHDGLFKSSGHRENLMSEGFSEIGIGQFVGTYTINNVTYTNTASMVTENFAEGGRDYLTGVVIADADSDNFYDIGEGRGGVTVKATGQNGTFTTTTWDAGGYSLELQAGTYTVEFSGGGLSGTITKTTTIGPDNQKLDAFTAEAVADANKIINGTSRDDTLLGADGNDVITGAGGNDNIDGGAGTDTAKYLASKQQVTITQQNDGSITVNATSTGEGVDTLNNIERIAFADGTLAFDFTGVAGQAYRIYKAAFARTPDNDGVKFWINSMDGGTSLIDVARGFVFSDEFKSVYGATPTSLEIVQKLYQNVLGRDGETSGINFWTGEINSGSRSIEQVLAGFSESPENIAGVAPVISDGIFFT